MKITEFKNQILPLRDKLFRLALRITQNQAEAEDIVQEVMMRMWNGQEEGIKIDNREAYCCTMTRNLALGKIHLKSHQNEHLDDYIHLKTNSRQPDEEVIQQDYLHLLHELIRQLPEKQRTILQFRDIEGMSYQEIANCMHISEEQVKINLFRSRKHIRALFLKIERYGLQKN